MKIIGHRGVAGLELENTLASVQKALELKLWAVEVDVRKTKDDHLVLCHDADLVRIAKNSKRVSDLTLKQLQKIPLLSGSHVPSLDEALELIGTRLCFIELKETGCGHVLLEVLKNHPKANVVVASFKSSVVEELKRLDPSLSLYALERTNPFEIVQFAKKHKLDGIGLNYWIINPLTYHLCKRFGIKIFVYAVDSGFRAKFLNFFYKDVAVCTNYPNRLLKKS